VQNENISPEMARFNAALRDVLSISKSELQQMLATEKQESADKPRRGLKTKVKDPQ
jgi:hypothetical protein